jgi:hypothetical protein
MRKTTSPHHDSTIPNVLLIDLHERSIIEYAKEPCEEGECFCDILRSFPSLTPSRDRTSASSAPSVSRQLLIYHGPDHLVRYDTTAQALRHGAQQEQLLLDAKTTMTTTLLRGLLQRLNSNPDPRLPSCTGNVGVATTTSPVAASVLFAMLQSLRERSLCRSRNDLENHQHVLYNHNPHHRLWVHL